MNAAQVVENLIQRFPNEPEYIQAVSQVLPTIEEEYNKHPEFEKANLIERLCIPDRVCEFRITWVDDKGNVQTNMGYRIQHNNAIGPYKGGLRYHKSVNLGILKFLAFEGNYLYLYKSLFWQCLYCNGRTCRVWFREKLGIHRVHIRKVVHVG